MDLVLVRWVDSCSSGGEAWTRMNEAVDTCKQAVAAENVSVGWVLYGDKKCLIIAAHLSRENPTDDDQCGGEICLPLSCVRHVRRIK